MQIKHNANGILYIGESIVSGDTLDCFIHVMPPESSLKEVGPISQLPLWNFFFFLPGDFLLYIWFILVDILI